MKTLTGKELEVMKILWKDTESLSAADIQKLIPEMSIYSVQQILRKLLKEGWIYIEKTAIQVKSLTRFFAPAISEAEYVGSFISSKTVFELTSRFIEETEDPKLIEKMEAIIETKKKEWKDE